MGNTWVVYLWLQRIDGSYEWRETYRGESMLKAIWTALGARFDKRPAIKIEWRP